MSQYIVSARKYRPDSFESLVGQDNIARTLKNSILRGKLAHAYLFCGPRGVGKTSTARIFAKTINCSNPTADMEPCGQCESCRSFQEGRSYCIHELDAASNNGVDDIKALMDQVQIPPQVGRYSVYIIDEVHMLSQAAFNAFLKTLEEPPAHAIFILATTEKHKILPTILSRCQTYDFNRISVGGIVSNLRSIADKEGITVDEESLHVIAQKADGAMRDALTIFDQTVAFCGTDIHYEDVLRNLNVLDYEYSFRLVDAFLSSDHATALLIFDEILSKGFNAQHFISALSQHLRDLLVSKTAGLESLLDLPESLKKRYNQQAESCSLQFLYDALGITTQCEAGYKASINQRLHIEFALMKLCFLLRTPAVAAAPSGTVGSGVAAAPSGAVAPQIREKVAPAPHVAASLADRDVAAVASAPVAPQIREKVVPGAHATAAMENVAPGAHATDEERAASATPVAPRARRRTAALSMSALMSDGVDAPAVQVTETGDSPVPSEEAVAAAWPEVIAAYKDKGHLYDTLSGAALEQTVEDGLRIVSFKVDNEAQKKWLEERILKDMEMRMVKMLGTGKVRISVGVVPSEERQDVAYTPAEKARELMGSNSEVNSLIIDLGLDTNNFNR